MKKRLSQTIEKGAKDFAKSIDYPADAFVDLPSVHITCRDDVVIESCKRILAIEDNKIVFDMGEYTVGLFGKDFVIQSLSKSGLCIEGTVATVTFDKKAENEC